MGSLLAGKKAVITGASGTIGGAIALEFANHGADVPSAITGIKIKQKISQ